MGAFEKLRKATISLCLSVFAFAWNNVVSTWRIFVTFIFSVFLKVCWGFNFHYNITKMSCILHENQCTFVVISLWILLKVTNISEKISRRNQNSYFIFSRFFFRKSCRLWLMWKNTVEPDRPISNNITQRMRFCVLDS